MNATVGILVAFLLGLLVNELTALSPWLATRLVQWAAWRWSPDSEVAAAYAEEWTAVVEERPGKLFKLVTATCFVCGAVRQATPRWFAGLRRGFRARATAARRRLSPGRDSHIRQNRFPLAIVLMSALVGTVAPAVGTGAVSLIEATVAPSMPLWLRVTVGMLISILLTFWSIRFALRSRVVRRARKGASAAPPPRPGRGRTR